MIPVHAPKGDFRFRIIGGGLQLRVSSAGDMANILRLDEALWAVTSMDIDALRFDRKFLEFIDCDRDNKIRSDEVKKAVQFTLNCFRDLSAVVDGKAELLPDAINPDAPGGVEAIECARLILKNLNRPEDSGITAQDILDTRSISSFAQRNGDGVISCESSFSAELTNLINAVIASGRKTADSSGAEGINLANLEAFQAALAAKIALLDKKENDPSIMVYGENTAEVFALFKECEELIESYFLNTEAGIFLAADPARPVKKDLSADLMVSENVKTLLAGVAVAVPGNDGVLDFDGPLNPLYADKLRRLADSSALQGFLVGRTLKKADYLRAKAALMPYAGWQSELAKVDGLDKFSEAELRELNNSALFDEVKELIASDLSFAPVVSVRENLLKMVLFQQYLMEFLNNFVSLPYLFNPDEVSRLQMGKLVMDGRHFTLTVKVKNPAEHKRIIKNSNICVIYVEVSHFDKNKKLSGELIAAAVTGGTMRSFFIGKHGVFFDSDGQIYDAVIRDIVEQPVSIGEAFKAPFFQFADFLSKQTEKIFNSRNAEMQKNLTTELNKAAPPAAAAKTAKPAAAPVAGNSLPMLLMGGGIGVAALGSSIAFIAKSLQNVSLTTVLAVLGGIIVIFGGPSVINALIKIFRRNLSRFLESCGCAVNRPMRMTRKMGSIFTFTPSRPRGEITLTDLVDELVPPKKFFRIFKKIFWIIIILLVIGAGVFGYWKFFRKADAVPQKCEKVQNIEKSCNMVEKQPENTKQPAAGKIKPSAEKTTQGDSKNASPAA